MGPTGCARRGDRGDGGWDAVALLSRVWLVLVSCCRSVPGPVVVLVCHMSPSPSVLTEFRGTSLSPALDRAVIPQQGHEPGQVSLVRTQADRL